MKIEQIFQDTKMNTVEINFLIDKEISSVKGVSKFGGKPDLPEDFEWPYFVTDTYDDKEVKSRPLAFLVQINCEEVSKYDTDKQLPVKGMLYFFYELGSQRWGFDPKDKGCAKVFYYDGNCKNLKSTEYPKDLDEDYRMPEIPIGFKNRGDVPDWSEYASYHETDIDWEEYGNQREKFVAEDDESEYITKLLGYADIIQNDMLSECEMSGRRGIYTGSGFPNMTEKEKKQFVENSKEWMLLVQLDTVEKDNFELMFGDCGRIYFYILRDDLRNKNFENIWLILQCY